jgi:hypothetical protein
MSAPTPLSPEEIEGAERPTLIIGTPECNAYLAGHALGYASAKAETADALTNLSRQLAEARAEVERSIEEALDVDRANFLAELERVTRERDEAYNEVQEHLSWLRLYVHDMSESNWRDMQLRLERQINRLADNAFVKLRRE